MIIDNYKLSVEQELNLWSEAMFVFDTSAILNLYEYSDETISDLFSTTFSDLEKRLWLPFNVSSEYISNRHKPIEKIKTSYDDLQTNLKNIENNIDQIANKTKSNDKHPFFLNDISVDFNSSFQNFKEKIKSEIKKQQNLLSTKLENDEILNKVNQTFHIGEKYLYSEICKIIKEGEFRFRNTIPPGYKDEDKKRGFQKYADLIIWKQILTYSLETQKSIIFIMDDVKEDWWILDKKRSPIMCRTELTEELFETSQKQFWMYQTAQFIEKSKKLLSSSVKTESIKNILEVSMMHLLSTKNINSIELSANREDEEPWRIKRLENVADFYSKTISNIKISELYDHKGTLTVYWYKEPSEIEKKTIQLAWENENESGENVEHIILK